MVRSLCPFRDPSFAYCPSIGQSGGILVAWNSLLWQMVDVHIGVYSVSVIIRDSHANCEGVATSVYGPNQSSHHSEFWAELSFVARKWQCPWVIGGDSNVIRFSSKKKGGCPVLHI